MHVISCPHCHEKLRVFDATPRDLSCPKCLGNITIKLGLPQAKQRPVEGIGDQFQAGLPASAPVQAPGPSPFDFDGETVAPAAPLGGDAKGLWAGVYCHGCGAWIHRDAASCPKCGVGQLGKQSEAKPGRPANPTGPILMTALTVLVGLVLLVSILIVGTPAATQTNMNRAAALAIIVATVVLFILGIAAAAVGFPRGDGVGVACGIVGLLGILGSSCVGLFLFLAIATLMRIFAR